MKLRGWAAAVAAVLTACQGMAQPPAEAEGNTAEARADPPLTIESFAKIPFVEQAELSPDGLKLGGLFGMQGHQVVGMVDLFDKEKRLFLALPEKTQATWVQWVNDDNLLVKLSAQQPVEGSLWYVTRLISLNFKTQKITRLLWNLNGQNASDVLWRATDGTPEILVAAQNSIYLGLDFWPSVYRVNVEKGTSRVALRPRMNVHDWVADSSGLVRAGFSYTDTNRTFRMLYRNVDGDTSFRVIDAADSRQRESLLSPFLFLPGTDNALVTHDDDEGHGGIYETNLLTRKDVRTVFTVPDKRAEVSYPILSGDGTALLGVASTGAESNVHWIDPALAQIQESLAKAVKGRQAHILSLSRDRSRMIVSVSAPDLPGSLYYFDTGVGVLSKIADMNEAIGGRRRLAPVRMITYKSRDGLEIEAVLTLPAGPASKNLPFIIMPHGGPWARDTLSYDYWAQFLAFKGYGVLQPNFRGSTGYGTDFMRAGEGQMGLAMQDDLTDSLRWAIKEGIADGGRTCIVGASYGGYAAMWGVAKDPELYRCAISIAGVASLRAEVNDFGDSLFGKKYQDDWKRMTPDFAAVSPVNAVTRIKAPLLLIHGKRDVTVDVNQSERMFAKMKEAGKTVDYLTLPLADHYFTREADRLALLKAMSDFLDKYNPATPPAGGTIAAASP